ncbi:DUF6970 domain-containing protein [Tenacibaculum geojense]|uniref:DUF6970 domain-containing protein n=1 Tax=Tenacibaculum geojense TaxID=915352 RepID=A0ABW3JP70_9FLAO
MKLFYQCLLFLCLISCAPKKEASQVNPIENKVWMQDFIKQIKDNPFPVKAMIVSYTYKNETVYLLDPCYQCPDAISTLYNAKHDKLCTFGGMMPNTNNCPDFFDTATDKKVLWKNFDE